MSGGNHDLHGLLAHVCWIGVVLGWFLTSTKAEIFGFMWAIGLWAFTLQPVQHKLSLLTRKITKTLYPPDKTPRNDEVLDLVKRTKYLNTMGLSIAEVKVQHDAELLLGSKCTTVFIITQDLPTVVLTIDKQSRVKGVFCVVADPPWNGCALYITTSKSNYISSASIELWRVNDLGNAESWNFSFSKGAARMKCVLPESESKVLRVRVANLKTADCAHLFTTTALDTGKLKNNRWSVSFYNSNANGGHSGGAVADVFHGELIDAQTTNFTKRLDGTVVQHRGLWLSLSLQSDGLFCLIVHTPVGNRVLFLTCFARPTAEAACAVLAALHGNNPLFKLQIASLQIKSCLQGSLHPSLTGDDVFGPGNIGDSSYVRFKPAMTLFDLEKPQFADLGKEQRHVGASEIVQVTVRI